MLYIMSWTNYFRKHGHEKLMDSLSGEIKQLRKKIEEKEGENDNGKNC